MARERTTKERVERIDLNYFKRPHSIRTRMRMLIVAAAIVSGGWLIVDAFRGSQRVYMPGPVSTGHAMFSQQCAQCHTPQSGGIYWRHVSDQACLKCHDGPTHQANQSFTPTCSSCHIEHRGGDRLASVTDQHCTQCHSNLATNEVSPHAAACPVKDHAIEKQVGDFTGGHPEFAVLRSHYQDPAQIKLNHQVHLKPGLKGLEKLRGATDVVEREGQSALACTYCHQPDARQAYMESMSFEKHCMACHRLQFDARFPETTLPHEQFDKVIPFVQEQFSAYVMDHPQAIKAQRVEPTRRLPGEPKYRQLPQTARAWVDLQVEQAKALMLRKTCKECHVIERQGEPVPAVISPAIPARWLVHSAFSHEAHRSLTCTACHSQALRSQATTDVLLPNVSSCQQCHNPSAARSSCSTCHTYHNQSPGRGLDGQLLIDQLRSGNSRR